MEPATRRRRRRLPLHQDLRPAAETAVRLVAPAMAAAAQAPAEAAAPTSIPSFHHSHHRHACPIPRRPLATRGPSLCVFLKKIRWEHPWISMVDVWPVGFVGGLPKPKLWV